ncbi:uncharacterized protein [Erythrolamprus reginae]|uniref:uncharacterized protein n=1 Tax=Erythrolamprus reginae TaxID=121349 RepID=UPI00396CC4B8
MEPIEKARNNHPSMEQRPKEEMSQLIQGLNPEGFSKEDEDFLSELNPEEKECLDFLMQTINNLDKEITEDDEKTEGSLGSQDPCQHRVLCSLQPQSQFEEDAPVKKDPFPAVAKSKMIKSLSEESEEVTLRRWSDLYCPRAKPPPRPANSYPTHFKKFDTILKSGVNVQELRSRFLRHLDTSAPAQKPVKDTLRLLSSSQRSMRDEAMQKLGFLQRDKAFLNARPHLPSAERPDKEAAVGSTHKLKK